ncbi:DJ-1/PfpI family protein [Tuanshanicoccus lijuaniae]|uniref:DJ-1 family glyoxalase III n=1 Tax=Aerococcaceae bacterium zg-1292 TaxID=2774330 RepID=UPI001934D951|nr:DJ-1/PfpI family protein [Aerococcaceae bacterium zg-1292]MBS4455771.1 DJ-1/PfpI family protein [Aerococcaceae bacterium zg-A91]MBS4457522.1 DJ-1/PfpI family protein [Aerococcaceae bacterium zg-BR33]QQA37035.1 DJ-1/PfpI family protein [Aerococcaceae bacterium zg-1292]
MKKFLVLLADGFEEIEALTPVDYLRRAGIEVDTASITEQLQVTGSHKITVLADKLLKDVTVDDYEGIYLPGGLPGATNLRDNDTVIELVQAFNQQEKLVTAICAAPIVLEKAGVIDGKNVTSFPSFSDELTSVKHYVDGEIVVTDGNIVTGRGAAIAIYESFKIIELLLGRAAVEKLKEGIQQDKVEAFYQFEA